MITIIQAVSLSKHFEIDDAIVEAIKDVNLAVEEGEFVSIYGPLVQERQLY